MKGGLGNMLRQAQAMQENLRKTQEELAAIEVTGTAGGGMVNVTLTCRYDVRRVQIDPALMQDDKEVLEDLVAAAFNDGVRKVEETTKAKMAGLTAGLNIPGLQLPF